MDITSEPLLWPPISEELAPFMKYCQGLVLNAGSGQRDIQLGQKDLNLDIVPANQPDVIADLHAIPLKDESVDTIVSIAVLEHTQYPWIVAQEFYRVLKPGCFGIIAVPFLQPQHACPNDFVRFTENGLVELMRYVGFEIVETRSAHHFGQTLAWLLWKYITANPPRKFMEPVWLTLIKQLSRGKILKGDSPDTHNTHYVIVQKPGQKTRSTIEELGGGNSKDWFFPLLRCPQTKQTLHREQDALVSEDGQFSYSFEQGIPTLLPQSDQKMRLIVQAEPDAEDKPVSQEDFQITFKPDILANLPESIDRIALLVSTEYEGLSKNGGIGTYYTSLSQKLAASGWYVVLLLCHSEESFRGISKHSALKQVFSVAETTEVLDLHPLHHRVLADTKAEDPWIDYQSLCASFFVQAFANCFSQTQLYVEFPETWGLGYRTIQAKQANLLGANCITAVTMHSGHEWIYEANEAYVVQSPNFFWKLFDYEQYSLKNADIAFFPSYFLKSKVESFGWETDRSQHMPYFVPSVSS